MLDNPVIEVVDSLQVRVAGVASDRWPQLSASPANALWLTDSADPLNTSANAALQISVAPEGAFLEAIATDGVTSRQLRLGNAGGVALVPAGGNVGIGTAAPTEALEVNGAIKATSFLLDNTPLISSQWTSVADGIAFGRGNLTTGRALLAMGTTDGSPANSNEVVGAIGFLGSGVQHGQLSFRAGRGFELVDRTADAPSLAYARDQYPYADLKVRTLTAVGNAWFGGDFGRLDGPASLALWGSRIGDIGNGTLFLRSGGNTVAFDGNDSVGIGLGAPRTQLHVLGRISSGLDFTSAGAMTFFPPDGFAWFHIDNGPAGGRPIGRLRITYGPTPGGHGEIISILQNNRVGINQPSPNFNLDVPGSVWIGDLHRPSDARFKTNVRPLAGVLDRLDKLQAVSFDWNETYAALGGTDRSGSIGVIAQEVEGVFPELVTSRTDDDYKGVDYGKLTAVLVQAVRELRAENVALASQNESLEHRIADLARMIDR